MDDHIYESFSDFLDKYYLCTYDDISDISLYHYIKKISDNFEPILFNLIISDTRNFVTSLSSYYNKDEEAYQNHNPWADGSSWSFYEINPIKSLTFDKDQTLSERIELVEKNDITIEKVKGFDNILRFSLFVENLYFTKIINQRSKVLNSKNVNLIEQAAIDVTPDTRLKLHSPLSTECLLAILDELTINKKLILKTRTVKDDWLYWFDRKDDLQNPHKIIWPTKHTILPNFIVHICGTWTLEAIKNAFDTKIFSNPKERDYIGKPLYNTIERIKRNF